MHFNKCIMNHEQPKKKIKKAISFMKASKKNKILENKFNTVDKRLVY